MKNLIVITGPTAVGKTELSVRLAKKISSIGIQDLMKKTKKILKIGDMITDIAMIIKRSGIM